MRAAACSPLAVLLLATLAVACFVAPERAVAGANYGLAITQQLYDEDGQPFLVANFSPDGGLATPAWARCAELAPTCLPLGVTNQALKAGPTPAGTTFEASASFAGRTWRVRSDAWHGTVTSTEPPTVSGTARVGERIAPRPAAWAGGWGAGDWDEISLAACRTPQGTDCVTIAHPRVRASRDGSAILDARWSGRYLFAFDKRYGRGTAFPAIGYSSPELIPPPAVGPTVARSAPHGPVRGPRLTLRERLRTLRGDRLLVGHVRCGRCQVRVAVRDRSRRHGAITRRTLRIAGHGALVVPRRALPTTIAVQVRVRVGSTPPVTVQLGPDV